MSKNCSVQANNHLIEEYLKEISNDNKDALSSLYHLVDTAIYSFALSMLRSHEDARDVMQDCFIKIYGNAASYQAKGKPMAWIITITRNLCLEKIRYNKRAGYSSSEELENTQVELPGLSLESRMILEECLESLSFEERQIIILHTITGLKHREIASVLDLPLATVLSKYHRGLKKLKNMLKEGDYHE